MACAVTEGDVLTHGPKMSLLSSAQPKLALKPSAGRHVYGVISGIW
jgi:hypothetical protein